MHIKILKPGLTVLGEVREVGTIVDDPNPDECRNLVADGRAEYVPLESDSPAAPFVEPTEEAPAETVTAPTPA